MGSIEEKVCKIEKNISDACDRSGRKRSDVTVIAVTKAVSIDRANEIMSEGFHHLGENRPEQLLVKQQAIQQQATWHFIGNIQSRKVKEFIDDIDYVHSIDRMSIVKEIQKRATQTVDCFVQVNVSGEESKSGLEPSELLQFIKTAAGYDKIRIIGLMTMAPNTDNQKYIRNVFKSLREQRDYIASQQIPNAPCNELSMGMSNDYVIAIEEGATYVRIGTALVGQESEGDK